MSDQSHVHQSGLTLAEQQAMIRDLPWRMSWQHSSQVHLDGCPSNYYYIAGCSEECERAHLMARRVGLDPDTFDAPNSGPGDRGGAAENYG